MNHLKIFPDSIINNSTEKIIADYRKKTNAIYLTVLFFILAAIVALFFIKIQIGVSASGIIKPKGERNLLTAPITGKLILINLYENASVKKDDTLFIVESPTITAQLPALTKRKGELTDMISDLQKLVSTQRINIASLASSIYTQSYYFYKAQLADHQHKEQVAQTNYSRQKKLYLNKVIPLSEFEQATADKNNVELARKSFQNSIKAQWQSELNGFKNELREVNAKIDQINIQHDETVVKAPMSGTVQSIEKVANGMFVHSGQQIAEISPDGQLVAECYISTKDIGFINVGQRARIQVDAFNYNDWGVLEGSVMEIFDDVVLTDNTQPPYYRIYCALDNVFLVLNAGHTGYIKKGMSVNAHFIVTERTLFQLIYDKVDDWLNPKLKQDE
jgi:HlyD family secretion protein